MLKIYDGNNYYRLLLETDHTGFAARGVLNSLQLETNPVVWVWDGENANAERRKTYPDYKRNRRPVSRDIYVGFDTLKQVLTHTRAIQIEIPGREGDDVVAALTRYYLGRGQSVAIYSNDFDFHQLLEDQGTGRLFLGSSPKPHVSPRLARHYKVLVGDPSDNIAGVGGFGEKTWADARPDQIERLVSDLVSGVVPNMEWLPKRVQTWLGDEGNRKLIQTYWQTVNFIDVPMEEINDHMIVGVPDLQKADAYLKEFMQ